MQESITVCGMAITFTGGPDHFLVDRYLTPRQYTMLAEMADTIARGAVQEARAHLYAVSRDAKDFCIANAYLTELRGGGARLTIRVEPRALPPGGDASAGVST